MEQELNILHSLKAPTNESELYQASSMYVLLFGDNESPLSLHLAGHCEGSTVIIFSLFGLTNSVVLDRGGSWQARLVAPETGGRKRSTQTGGVAER